MATVTRYVDLNSTAGGDGTTNATSGANRAYASLNEWLTAEGTDLVAAGDSHVCIIAAGEYAETLTLSSSVWTCDASNTLTVRAATGDECTALDFSNGVRLVANPGATSGVISVSAAYTRVIGIGAYASGGNSESSGWRLTGNSTAGRVIERCVGRGSTHGTSNGFKQLADELIHYINCIAVDSGGEGWDIDNFDNARLYNCLAINNGSHGFFRSGTSGTRPRAINCVAFGNAGDGFNGGFNTTLSSNNASDDATSAGVNVVDDALTSGDFSNAAGGDFSPSAGSSLRGAGVDLSSDFTTDFLGVTRSAWDVGPYEYVSSGAVAFIGSVPTLDGTEDAAFSEDLSGYFTGSATPFTYTLQSGTLPDGLSLGSSTGIISGTPTTAGTATGIVIRATDDNSDTADTNSFSIDIASAVGAISFSGTVPTQNLTEDVAMTPLDLSSYFSGSETPFAYTVQTGTLPDGLSLGSSTGEITGTPTEAGTFPVVVRGTDSATNTADTNEFDIVVASAVATVTVTLPLKNNTGTLWASETGIKASVLDATTLASVYEATGLTTNASGLLEAISNAAITASSSYHVAIKLPDGSVGITGPITAT